MINLSKDNIVLRALEPEDINLLYKWENTPEVWHVSNTLVPISTFILKKYLANSHLDIYQTQQLRLVIELIENGEKRPLGAIDLFEFDPIFARAGVGILIYELTDRNKGFASTALEILIDFASKHLRIHQLFCNIAENNHASIKLFQSKGFKISGTKLDWIKIDGEWQNEHLLQKILD